MSDEPLSLAFDRSSIADRALVRRWVPAPSVPVVPDGLRDDVRAMALRGWEDRARSEYVGVMVVRHFHGLLVDLNAPMDLQELALVMMQHEQRHTAACIAAVRALGGSGEVVFDVDELQLRRSRAPLDQQLLEMVVGTYAVGEVTALGLLRHAIRALPPSDFRAILQGIARDEGLHAGIGPAMLTELRAAAWFRWPGDEAVRAMARTWIDAMRARDVIEPDEAALFDDPVAAEQLPRLGIPDSRAFLAAYHRALDRDVTRALGPLGLA